MATLKDDHEDAEAAVGLPARARRRTFTADYKLRVVDEYDSLDALGRGALLRREGLYTSHISEWRRARDRGAKAALDARRGPVPASREERRIAQLEARNAALEHELATARQVVKVQGELAALLKRLSSSSATPTCESEADR
jgi:transposase-like protein